jgi:hypothetical protein
LFDTDASHELIVVPGSNLTANRTLTVATGDADRTLTLNNSVALNTSTLAWSEVTGTSQNAAVNNAYITNNAALVTVTLPTTAAIGDRLRIVAFSSEQRASGLFRQQYNHHWRYRTTGQHKPSRLCRISMYYCQH